jgi:hypothetical protein
MDRYTRAVSGQRLGKHVPVARQQILNNATVRLQQWVLFSTWSVPRCYKQGTRSVESEFCSEYVKRGIKPEAEE